MTCSQNTLLAAVLADSPYSEVNQLCMYSVFDRWRPHISYAWVNQQSRAHTGSCNRNPVLPGLSGTTPSLLRLATSTLDLDGAAPSLCLMPTPPSMLPHPKTCEFRGFCLIYLLLDLLTHTVDPVLAAPWDMELISLGGSPEVHVRLKAALLPHRKH